MNVALIEGFPYHLPMKGSKADLAGILGWLLEAGADEAAGHSPINRFSVPQAGPAVDKAARIGLPTARVLHKTVQVTDQLLAHVGGVVETASQGPSSITQAGDSIGKAMESAAACHSLSELKAAVEAFDGCQLKKFATRTVFADGTPQHGIMLIGEAPGRDEDIAGLPFVGRAGKLLDKMLAAIGLDRKKNVYITNVLNWRPPENRDPSPEEAASCLPFLRRHIELAAPQVIVLLGAVSARHVMGKTDGIMRLRGKWLEYHVNGHMVPVMPTLHPAYLLRRAIDKKLAWRDLQAIASKVNSLKLLEAASQRR
jgi:DNA polymerase